MQIVAHLSDLYHFMTCGPPLDTAPLFACHINMALDTVRHKRQGLTNDDNGQCRPEKKGTLSGKVLAKRKAVKGHSGQLNIVPLVGKAMF